MSLPTTAARVLFQARSCGIYGGQNCTGISFLRALLFPLPSLIPPAFTNPLILPSNAVISGRVGSSPAQTFLTSRLVEISGFCSLLDMYLLRSGASSWTRGGQFFRVSFGRSDRQANRLTDWLLNCCWPSPAQWFLIPNPRDPGPYLTPWRLCEPSENYPTRILTTPLSNQLLKENKKDGFSFDDMWNRLPERK
jgi:hypothetical protein